MATQFRNLIYEGGTEVYFQWFEDPSEAPVNRVAG